MKVSEKALELNIGAELLATLRGPWGLPKAYLQGLTQKEERQQGVDFFAQLSPEARLFAFQFKAPRGSAEQPPYKFTLSFEQHMRLDALAKSAPGSVYYVLPFYLTHKKLTKWVPRLADDTWLLSVSTMNPAEVFAGRATRTMRCESSRAYINPEYRLLPFGGVIAESPLGIPASTFASWYADTRGLTVNSPARSPATRLLRGLKVVIVEP